MISIEKILKRSWQILWNYRVLWIFGFLLALTTGGNGGGNGGGSGSRTSMDGNGFSGNLPNDAPEWMHQFVQWFTQNVEPLFMHPEQYIGTIVLVVAVLIVIGLLIGALMALVRYPAETAVIRMVDEYEQSGSKLGFRQSWKLGWTRRAFRLWLVDLILMIPVLLFLMLVIGATLVIIFSVSSGVRVAGAVGVIGAIGLIFLGIFLLVVVSVVLGLLRNFFARAVAIDGLGVQAALQTGWAMVKRNWKSAGLMWLVMVGISILFGIASMILFFLLIPAYLVLLVPAALVAALPGLISFGITSIFAAGPLAWIIGIVVAMPFFFTIVFAPLFFLDGLFKVYDANVWTLTYREIKAIESMSAPGAAAPELPGE